jgi:carbamoyltransferase
MKILGISAYYHDSAAALVVDGQVVAAAQEERFSRIKHDPSFPAAAIRYCLEEGGLSPDDLDAVAFYEKPFPKFERLLDTHYAFAPRGVRAFLKAMPVWVKEKLFIKNRIIKGLKEIGPFDKNKIPLLFPEHHLSHAASAFYASPFRRAAILTLDGVGEWTTASISLGEGEDITILKELRFPHSLGLLYSAFTYFLGFKVNSGEYKLMGLAPYGNADSEQTQSFIRLIKEYLVHIHDDGSIWLDQSYFGYAAGLRMAKDARWERLFGMSRRLPESDIQPGHCNLAFAIQAVTEEIVSRLAGHAREITGAEHLCMAGGVALNCVANGRIIREGHFQKVFIQPAAGDAGGALGAAWAAHHIFFGKKRELQGHDLMQGAYLGPGFDDWDIRRFLRERRLEAEHFPDEGDLLTTVANHLASRKVVGWMQGRMEFGPRALGARSILGDPRSPAMQRQINLKIKYRESFRPFAPVVLEEDAGLYFEMDAPSPYMLQVHPVREDCRLPLPEDYPAWGMREKLETPRSNIPAVTHVDFSARIQTVNKDPNPRLHGLLRAFKERTGIGMLVNTSFNVRGEPIVCTPADAYRCFMSTEMDVLVMGDFVLVK